MMRFAEIYQEYAQSLDKPELNEAEKKQAVMNAVLDGVEIDGPPGSLEWYMRGLQEQMSRYMDMERRLHRFFRPGWKARLSDEGQWETDDIASAAHR